jgi:hypothetical protein
VGILRPHCEGEQRPKVGSMAGSYSGYMAVTGGLFICYLRGLSPSGRPLEMILGTGFEGITPRCITRIMFPK